MSNQEIKLATTYAVFTGEKLYDQRGLIIDLDVHRCRLIFPENDLHPIDKIRKARNLVTAKNDIYNLFGVSILSNCGTYLEALMRASEKHKVEELFSWFVVHPNDDIEDVTLDKAEMFRTISEANRRMFLNPYTEW